MLRWVRTFFSAIHAATFGASNQTVGVDEEEDDEDADDVADDDDDDDAEFCN